MIKIQIDTPTPIETLSGLRDLLKRMEAYPDPAEVRVRTTVSGKIKSVELKYTS